MIKANELRIGNYVMDLIKGNVKVEAEDILQVYKGQAGCEPIILTNEILEKCPQFSKNKLGPSFYYELSIESEYGQTSIESNDIGGGIFLIDIDSGTIGIEIKYLHQLQNLFFALSGEELEVKL